MQGHFGPPVLHVSKSFEERKNNYITTNQTSTLRYRYMYLQTSNIMMVDSRLLYKCILDNGVEVYVTNVHVSEYKLA